MLPQQALAILKEGNKVYQESGPQFSPLSPEDRALLRDKQEPLAIILSCSDSRVPPELIFNQSHGNLFVIRVAGNICSPVVTETIDLALLNFNTPLIIVMGHECCAAITQTLHNPDAPYFRTIINAIKPSLNELKDDSLENALLSNITYVTKQLEEQSDIIAQRLHDPNSPKLGVFGAYYEMATGHVRFLD